MFRAFSPLNAEPLARCSVMGNAPAKTFDAVQSVRVIRNAVSAVITPMSVEDENRWP